MTHLDNRNESPVLPANFGKLTKAFHQAIARKEIIGIISPGGVGFKYTLKCFAEKHYLKIVYCNVRHSESIREVVLTLYRNLCNVKFSNLDYRRTTIFDLARVLNYRLALGDSCLLCIDNCNNLKPAQLKYFTQFLDDFDKPIGLVFRMSEHYAHVVSRAKKFQSTHGKLLKVVDNWRILKRCTDDELREIANAKISDPNLVDDLINASQGNLSVLTKHIERIKRTELRK